MKIKFCTCLTIFFCLFTTVKAQEAYFVDGFHGGIWGHYPEGYTQYMLSLLEENPDWRLNLEIEPETWDRAKRIDNANYVKLQDLLADTSHLAKVEYVNPSYAQSYLYNTPGESIIRQFSYGIDMLEDHFPGIEFVTYSSEEPCFTSSLPQILKSFGIRYASLKNPNTCWGGYTRAHGGELVNWIGPDGTSIPTVPRYEFEKLKPESTWETIGNANSHEYVKAAFDYGVEHPLGMCLQDAGWEWGTWLKGDYYKPSIYTTWRNYFENVVDFKNSTDWHVDQEDIQVSLVWGSQVLQKLAQQVRVAENNMIQAEKIASINNIENGTAYPSDEIDSGWKSLLLAQHHDCWIVPYNGKKGDTWADKVVDWTDNSNTVSERIIRKGDVSEGNFLKIYNTLGTDRSEFVEILLPEGADPSKTIVTDGQGKRIPFQTDMSGDSPIIVFKAWAPAFGYNVYQLKSKRAGKEKRNIVRKLSNGDYVLETNLYRMVIDGKNGGAIKSLVAKELDNKEFVDQKSGKKFNTLQGNFYDNGGMHTNLEKEIKLEVLEDGPYRAKLAISSYLLDTPVTTTITLAQDEPRIDFKLHIDWKENIGIGSYKEIDFDAKNLKKAFYDDRTKLLALFPLDLKDQKVFKNAPFDVMQSGLENTFFDSWDSIKHNVILDWVDITDGDEKYGCALFSDHTTSYAHGTDFPLALNIQYSGIGLWGRNYSIEGPTEVNYSLLPHKGNWKEAGIWNRNELVKEPLHIVKYAEKPARTSNSLIGLSKKGWVLSSVTEKEGDIYVRIFNAEGDSGTGTVDLGFDPGDVKLVELNGEENKELQVMDGPRGPSVQLAMPQFGFRTLKISKPANN